VNVDPLQRLSWHRSALSALAGFSSALAKMLEVDTDPAVAFLASLLDTGTLSTGVLYLTAPHGRLRLHTRSGQSHSTVTEAEQFFDHPELFDQCLERGQPIAIPSALVPEFTARRVLGCLGVASAVIVPLVSRDEVLGVLLMAARQRDLTDEDWLAFAQTVAGQIAQAIALSRTFSRLLASEQRYRGLFDRVPVGLYRTTVEGRFLEANRALLEVLGFSGREELLATSAADLYVNREDRGTWQASMDRDGVVRGFEVQFRRRDGSPIWGRENTRTLPDADGTRIYEGSLEDITERRRAEEALRESGSGAPSRSPPRGWPSRRWMAATCG
jgi:PAS domain S-box-containing protein